MLKLSQKGGKSARLPSQSPRDLPLRLKDQQRNGSFPLPQCFQADRAPNPKGNHRYSDLKPRISSDRMSLPCTCG